ncbi:hypothetical protein FLX56_26050 [Synechococcus moorigangaii CMS01]|nr:hypothetical protein [Synechococcus moorigangaii CMS01]
MFNKNQSSSDSTPEPEQLSASVRIIGDRKSGKTTYMAALARWPNADPETSVVQQVFAINEDGEDLIQRAQDVLEQGDQLEGTPLDADVDDVKDYGISIVLKQQFSWRNLANGNSSLASMNVNCKDYSGEFFSDVLYKTGSPLLEDYLEDCVQANGLMLLVDGSSYRNDNSYATGLERFLTELDRTDLDVTHRRIALVMTKCEQSDLWINSHQPAELARLRFPKVLGKLRAWERRSAGTVDCFATSAFGMLGRLKPAPNMRKIRRNRDGLQESVLKNPSKWKPFGLVAPIYWLCTGERHKELEKE